MSSYTSGIRISSRIKEQKKNNDSDTNKTTRTKLSATNKTKTKNLKTKKPALKLKTKKKTTKDDSEKSEKKQKKKHPSYQYMVLHAICELKERTGSSRKAIENFILNNYANVVDLKSVHMNVRRICKLHTQTDENPDGLLTQNKQSFRISTNRRNKILSLFGKIDKTKGKTKSKKSTSTKSKLKSKPKLKKKKKPVRFYLKESVLKFLKGKKSLADPSVTFNQMFKKMLSIHDMKKDDKKAPELKKSLRGVLARCVKNDSISRDKENDCYSFVQQDQDSNDQNDGKNQKNEKDEDEDENTENDTDNDTDNETETESESESEKSENINEKDQKQKPEKKKNASRSESESDDIVHHNILNYNNL